MWRAFVCALGFLTRIPAPHVELREEDVARSAGFFAWIGALIAGLLWACGLASESFGARISALLLVAIWAFVTGGLHLDGLADTFDGLSGGRGKRERILEIMRDSRIGSHGAVALGLVLALKWAALERLLELGSEQWLMAPVVARLMCTLLLAVFPYARTEGLGSAFAGRVGARELVLGALPLVLWIALRGTSFAASAMLAALVALAFSFRLHRLLGGLTGDVQGAAIELCETAMLLALCRLDLR